MKVLLVLVLLAAFYLLPLDFSAIGGSRAGRIDWQAFWSAFQLFRSAGNPYDPSSLFAVQQAAGSEVNGVLMFWNPPWLFAALWPVLALPVETSVQVWFALNLLFAFAAGVLSWRIARPGEDIQLLPCVLATLSCFPFYFALWFGQLSVFIVLCLVVVCFAFSRGHDKLGAISLIFSAVKPNLVFHFAVYFLFWALLRQRKAVFLYLVIFFALITGPLLIQNSDVYFQWLDAVSGSASASALENGWLVSPAQWRTTTVATLLSTYAGGKFYAAFCWLMPAAGIVLVVFLSRFERFSRWESAFPYLLCLSIIFAPYAWIHDYFLLMPVQVMICALVFKDGYGISKRVVVIAALVAIEGLGLAMPFYGNNRHLSFTWIPVAMLLLWHFSCANVYRPDFPVRE